MEIVELLVDNNDDDDDEEDDDDEVPKYGETKIKNLNIKCLIIKAAATNNTNNNLVLHKIVITKMDTR